MYVVYLEPQKGERPFERPFKAFSARPSAAAFATESVTREAEKAIIIQVDGIDDARKAIAAVEMGEGRVVDARSKRPTEAELKRECQQALAGGLQAFLRYRGFDI